MLGEDGGALENTFCGGSVRLECDGVIHVDHRHTRIKKYNFKKFKKKTQKFKLGTRKMA